MQRRAMDSLAKGLALFGLGVIPADNLRHVTRATAAAVLVDADTPENTLLKKVAS